MFMQILSAAMFFVAALAVWVFIFNRVTGRERQALIAAMFSDESVGDDWVDAFDAVSYDRHLLHRMLLRNFSELYPPEFVRAAKEGRHPYWKERDWKEREVHG